ncbi:MAG: DNA-formamidopyrimidine glycosylase family protein [Planctomycetota bacterium]
MPEGHKTHHLARQHTQQFAGQTLRISSPQGRFTDDAKKIDGVQLNTVTAVGKHLFYDFDNELILQIHLGRYGKFRLLPTPPPSPVGAVRMRVIGEDHTLDLNGPTRCRVIDAQMQTEITDRLGPDPLAGGKKKEVRARIASSRKTIGALLLDQSVVAGIGNIFRAEILFESQVDPETPGEQLSDDAFDRIWKATLRQMKAGLRLGKIVSVTSREAGRSLASLEGNARFRVYGHTDCPECGDAVQQITSGGRRLYCCNSCQTNR